jgi:sentrin-specific protease 7
MAQAVGRHPSISPKRGHFNPTSKEEPPKKKIRVSSGSPDVLQEQGSRSAKLALERKNHLIEETPSTSSNSVSGRQQLSTSSSRVDSPNGVVRSKKVQAPWKVPTSTTSPVGKKNPPMEMVISDDDEASFTKGAAQERKRREDSDDDIQEIGEARRISSRNATTTSTVSAQQQSSSSPKRIDELEEILPDDILRQGPAPNSSPDVIQEPHFKGDRDSRTSKRPRKASSSEPRNPVSEQSTLAHVKLYRPTRMLFGRGPVDVSNYELVVDKKAKTFSIRYTGSLLCEEPILPETPVDRILKVLHGVESAKIKIETSKIEMLGNHVLLELKTQKLAYELALLLPHLGTGINVECKGDDYLEKVFDNFDKISKQEYKGRRTSHDSVTMSPYFQKPNSRRRSGSTLDYATNDRSLISGNGAPHTSNSQQSESASGRRQRMLKKDLYDRGVRDASNQYSDAIEESGLYHRLTRASTTRTSPKPPVKKYSHFENLGAPWKSPLTYPQNGKKRATVNFDDLLRLDDDEFLNDNIIAFFLRYLEHYLEQEKPDIAKRTHFFNSYFYEKLRQNPKDKKSINYEGVKKWTDKIGLFNRDFIVVPVNENLHWYLAIICNLSWFKSSQEERDAADAPEVVNESLVDLTPVAETDTVMGNTENTQQSLQDLTLDDRERQSDILVSDVVPESSGKSNGSAKKKGRKRKSERPLIGVNSRKPAIITLDSLGLARYATTKALKEYVVQEGKAKLNIDINESEISGLAAKRIPMQKNFSDCGLFVCAYLEKFTVDPADFKTKELERIEQDWGELHSDVLRSRMRELIQTLHAKQEGNEADETVPDVGKILLPPPKSPRPSSNDVSLLTDNRDETMYNIPTFPLRPDARPPRREMRSSVRSQASDSEDEVIEYEADPTLHGGNQVHDPKNLQARTARILQRPSPRRHVDSFEVAETDSENEELARRASNNNPVALAKILRDLRSPQRAFRGHSVSTEFLDGNESYEHTEQRMPDDEMDRDEMLLD